MHIDCMFIWNADWPVTGPVTACHWMLNKMERTSTAFVDEKIFCGFLEMETKAQSGVFQRRFLRLDPDASTLEYFADRQQVVCRCGYYDVHVSIDYKLSVKQLDVLITDGKYSNLN